MKHHNFSPLVPVSLNDIDIINRPTVVLLVLADMSKNMFISLKKSNDCKIFITFSYGGHQKSEI